MVHLHLVLHLAGFRQSRSEYPARYGGADPTLRLHDLRHVTGQLLVNSGATKASVQTTMRHATAAMTRRYAKQKDHGENARALAVALGLRASA